VEPSLPEADSGDTPTALKAESAPRRSVPQALNKIVTLRLVPKDGAEFSAEQAVLALKAGGLKHGEYGIFHFFSPEDSTEAEFSVASLIEPGSFDLTKIKDAMLPGMSFFMLMPGLEDPVVRFDHMVQLARNLTQHLNGELFDEGGSSWSIQRERYVREEIIEYRHHLTRT